MNSFSVINFSLKIDKMRSYAGMGKRRPWMTESAPNFLSAGKAFSYRGGMRKRRSASRNRIEIARETIDKTAGNGYD